MILTVMNEKGGTGKTTLAVHLAYFLAVRRKRRTLLVDLDPQAQASKSLGVRTPSTSTLLSHHLFQELVDLEKRAQATGRFGLSLVPAEKTMAFLPPPAQEEIFARNIRSSGFQETVLDTPPSPSWMTRAALSLAQVVVIPVALTYLAMDGSAELLRTITGSFPHLRERVFFAPTFYRHTRMAGEILERMKGYFGQRVLPPVGISVRMDEAQSHGQTIWEYAPHSPIAEEFTQLCRVLIRLLEAG